MAGRTGVERGARCAALEKRTGESGIDRHCLDRAHLLIADGRETGFAVIGEHLRIHRFRPVNCIAAAGGSDGHSHVAELTGSNISRLRYDGGRYRQNR